MTLLQEIRNDFAGIAEGAVIRIESLGSEENIIVSRDSRNGLMIGMQIDDSVPGVNESFTSCHLFDSYFFMNGSNQRYLFLSCSLLEYRREFASLCCEFVEPGPGGQYRKELLTDPLAWWLKWINLLGNTVSERNIYCVIAEMIALDFLFQNDNTVTWLAAKAGVRDIESDTETFEVKSTIRRTGHEAVISSSFQLDSDKNFWILFCRMEENKSEGVSIRNMFDTLVGHGYDRQKLTDELSRQGLDLSNHICGIKYKAIEKVKYLVDDDFPKIVDASFVGGHRPNGIDKITYTVDLASVKGEIW